MSSLPPIAALIVAAGRGSRVGGDVPKQDRRIGGRSILAITLARLGAVDLVERITTVIHADDGAAYAAAAGESGVAASRLSLATGGATRQDSVRLGLEALAAGALSDEGLVLIYDAARPFLSEAVLLRAITAAARHGAAIPVLPVPDTLAVLDAAGTLAGNHDRASARMVQTPQAFRFGAILDAHRKALADGRGDFTDDAGVVAAYGHAVHVFAGDTDLFKITEEADLARAERHDRSPGPGSALRPSPSSSS